MSAAGPSGGVTVLVGDVGGTHARFAVVDTTAAPWRIDKGLDLEAKFPSFAEALRAYLAQAGLARTPDAVAIAVAGPVTAGRVTFTNRGWSTSEDELRTLGFRDALLINDFAALAFAATGLDPTDIRTIGPELAGLSGEPISIIGAGTGFGASLLARFRGRTVPVATEAGHMGFAPGNARERAVLPILARRFGHVSVERVLSGPGLENLFTALAENGARSVSPLAAADIVAGAQAGDDACREALEMFCEIYGAVAGDLALAHGARGGVFLAGGIAQKIEATLARSGFRARFEDKGRLSSYVKAIPTRLMRGENAAFLGAARASLEFRTGAGQIR